MSFTVAFFLNTTLASLFALFWFSSVGLLVLKSLGFSIKNNHFSWLLAPSIGVCSFGSFALLLNTITGLSSTSLVISWFCLLAILYYLSKTKNKPSEITDQFRFSLKALFLILIGAVLFNIWVVLNIYPFIYQGALLVNEHIFDHAKVALVDAIAREGLLPVNPYYAPAGETIPLIYYYTWHFLAAQLKLLTHATGWQAEVAMTWFTGFAAITLLMAMAAYISVKKHVAAALILVVALTGPFADILLHLLGPRWHFLVGQPPVHGLELLWLQMAWVPQHVLAAMAIILLLFFISRIALLTTLHLPYALIAGLVTATGFGASTLVGGIALALALPFLLASLAFLPLSKPHYQATLYTALLALLCSIIFALPNFISQLSGPELTETQFPLGIELYLSTNLTAKATIHSFLIHVALFWLLFLPLNLGITYLLGIPAIILHKATDLPTQSLKTIHLAALFSFLVIIQFVQSTFWNNSFGWRAALIPVMLLLIWSAVLLSNLFSTMWEAKHWRFGKRVGRYQHFFLALAMAGVTLGLLASMLVYRLPNPHLPPLAERLELHRGFLRQREGWAKVREYVAPHERVQSNPDGYANLTPWPATLPYALFADRKIAYANVEYSTVFAYRYDQQHNQATYQLMQNIFSATPDIEHLRTVRDTYQVKALLVDRFDDVWHSPVLDESGIYQRVYADEQTRIYLAE